MKTTVLATELNFPEGPVVTKNGNIYFVELTGGSITQYKRTEKAIKRYAVGGAPNGMMVQDDDTLLFCDSKQHAIRSLDLKTGQTATLADRVDGKKLHAPNDIIQDRDNNVLFTCPGGSQKDPVGYLCAMNEKRDVSVIADGMYFPNGLLLINDEKNIIINETWQHRLLIGDWNKQTLKIENLRPFYRIGGKAEPDGLTLSPDGLIYAAVFNTGKVWVFDTDGNLKNQIELSGNCPTNLCFDSVGNLGLLVTEAEKGMLLSIK